LRKTAVGASSGSEHTSSLRLLSSLFFIWEFISATNIMLLPHLRSVFDLSYAASLCTQCEETIATTKQGLRMVR